MVERGNMAKYTTETDHLFQWSQGYRLQVPKAYKDCVTQFYSEDYPNGLAVAPESYEKEGGKILCPLPNQLTVNTNSIIVYAYRLETGKAYTESKTVLSVWARPKPEDYVFVPTDVVTYQTAIELIADMREALVEEGLRVEAETLRAEAEALRVESEATRVEAESERADAEFGRAGAEASRIEAEEERDFAESSRVTAESSRVSAEASRTRTWSNATARATDGDTPSASVTVGANGVEFDFTLVRGLKGDTGNDGYTPQKNVDYFDGYTPRKGIDYFDGEKGDTGDTGNGISSVQLVSGTHAAGTTDTYRITMTNGTTFDFGVYNGANGQAGEGSGDMLSTIYDPQHRNTDIFAYVDNKESFSGDYNDLINKPSIPSKLSDLSADSTHRVVTDAEKTSWNAKSTFSGAYNDLTGKPTIPTALSDLSADTTHRTVTDTEKTAWNGKADASTYASTSQYGVTKLSSSTSSTSTSLAATASAVRSAYNLANGKYSKPSGGIPSTDLASAVQTSLGKADTALQEHQDISGKANKPTTSTFTLLASGWTDNTYALGYADSNLEIELDASATDEMVEAWSNAKMVGSASSNTLTAKGDVPTIDITCILKRTVK